MIWAEQRTESVGSSELVDAAQAQLNHHLYRILVDKTQGEAFNLVKDVEGTNGVEAWRKLTRRLSGRTRGKRLHLTRLCVNPPPIKKVTDVLAHLEKWELNVRRLANEYNETLSGGLKMGILSEMMPSDMADYLSTKLEDEDTYDDVKEQVLRYVEAKAGRGVTPMRSAALSFSPRRTRRTSAKNSPLSTKARRKAADSRASAIHAEGGGAARRHAR